MSRRASVYLRAMRGELRSRYAKCNARCMNTRALERLFHRILVAGASAALVACSSSSNATFHCSPPGYTDVALTTLAKAVRDATVPNVGGDGGTSPAIAAGDFVPASVCLSLCPPSGVTSENCRVDAIHGDSATLVCTWPCGGRRPEGLDRATLPGAFAEMARLEAASVHAFRRLRDELARNGGPRRLLRACSRAARDEVRHTRIAAALARRFGQRVEAPRIAATEPRSVEAIALENAVEGCVRETWGALVATRDARVHPDAAVRAAMKRIARDETRHAALAWAVAAWLEPRLNRDARARVREARSAEARIVVAQADDPRAAIAIARALWSEAAA